MPTKTHLTLILCAALLALMAPGQAMGDPLGPDSVLFNSDLGTSPNFTDGSLAATHPTFSVLVDTLTAPFDQMPTNPGITGSLTTNVWLDPSTSALAFEYLFGSTGPSSLIRATLGGSVKQPWLGVSVLDVGADGTGSSTTASNSPNWTDGDPAFVTRDPTGNGEGIALQWRVILEGTQLDAGNTSSNIWFVTNTTNYQAISVGLQDSGAVSGATGLGPVQPIPEPGTIMLTGLGLVALFRVIRKKRV